MRNSKRYAACGGINDGGGAELGKDNLDDLAADVTSVGDIGERE